MGQGMPSALQQPSQRVIENQTTSIFSINTISHYQSLSSPHNKDVGFPKVKDVKVTRSAVSRTRLAG